MIKTPWFFFIGWSIISTIARNTCKMVFRLYSRILCDVSSKSKYWNVRQFYGARLSVTGCLGPRMCTQTFLQAARQSRNCLGSRMCFKRGLNTETVVSKEKRSDLRRLFSLARPEALRITGMVRHTIVLNLQMPSACNYRGFHVIVVGNFKCCLTEVHS